MEHRNTKAKIVVTAVVLLSTLAFVALGTFAWFTMSKQGEVSGITVGVSTDEAWPFQFIEQRASDSENWTTTEDVLDAKGRNVTDKWKKMVTLAKVKYTDGTQTVHEVDASDCYQLRPISTSNLKEWFLPKYDSHGEIVGVSEVPLDVVGNINRFTASGSEEGHETPTNYVYYYDLWVRTTSNDHDYNLHLNNPLNGYNDLDLASRTEEFDYGTYVLPALVEQVGKSVATLSSTGYDMSTCLRIGLAIYDTNPDDIKDATISEYWIYEPNCDTRAKYFTSYKAATGSTGNYESQKEDTYILDNGAGTKVVSHESMNDGQIFTTLLPHATHSESEPLFIDADAWTIKQLKSTWKENIDLDNLGPRGLDSTYIEHFGAFTSEATGDPGLYGVDTPALTSTPLTKGTPVHIRVFVWMEGQDVDCWNSSLKGSLKIGLEFRGAAVPK